MGYGRGDKESIDDKHNPKQTALIPSATIVSAFTGYEVGQACGTV